MCGICGFFQYKSNREVDKHVLFNMNKVIHHRGPDDEGFYFDKGLAMAMRRLSIIDLASGKQPIYNEDKSIVIVFNGEIYNYQELSKDLKKRGHTFSTKCDTEVIVHLYEEMGEECVHQLRGMFAFSLWDKRKNRFFAARDRMGIKPFYYSIIGNELIFGSEIKSILQHPKVEANVNVDALNNFLTLKYVPSPQTMYKGIESLPPGHILTCDKNGIKIKQYWDIAFTNNDLPRQSENAYIEQFDSLLRESIKLRLRSDVPFGAFLSGGIDSSIIVAIMSQILNDPVKTFSVGFDRENKNRDELRYARMIAEKYQTDHFEMFITPKDFVDMAEKVAWHLDQPLADQATAAVYMVSKLASQHVKMVLTGEGGDELFAGYARYSGERLSPIFNRIPKPFKSFATTASEYLPGLHRPKIALQALCQSDEAKRFSSWFPLFHNFQKSALLSKEIKNQLNGASTNTLFASHLENTNAKEPLNRMLYVDSKLWLPDYLLLRGDRLSMAASIEARVPFLDHKIVEFAASVPPNLKLKHLTHKYLLKEIGKPLLPEGIISRKKEGFPIPITQWMKKEARPFVHDILSPDIIKKRGLFDVDYVAKLIKDFESGFSSGFSLWGLISIELWQRNFIDAQG